MSWKARLFSLEASAPAGQQRVVCQRQSQGGAQRGQVQVVGQPQGLGPRAQGTGGGEGGGREPSSRHPLCSMCACMSARACLRVCLCACACACVCWRDAGQGPGRQAGCVNTACRHARRKDRRTASGVATDGARQQSACKQWARPFAANAANDMRCAAHGRHPLGATPSRPPVQGSPHHHRQGKLGPGAEPGDAAANHVRHRADDDG